MAPLRAIRTLLAAPYSMLTAASPYPDRCGSLQGSLFATVSPAAERIAKYEQLGDCFGFVTH